MKESGRVVARACLWKKVSSELSFRVMKDMMMMVKGDEDSYFVKERK